MIANIQHWTELIAKKLSGNIRADEDRMLEAWIARDPEHSAYYDEMVSLWSKSEVTTHHTMPVADFTDLQKRIAGQGKVIALPELHVPKVTLGRLPRRAIAAAAAVLVLAAAGITLLERANRKDTLIVATVEQNVGEVQLPDGSTVFLRRGSTLTYDRAFHVRSVTLQGEGFFSVMPDSTRPFTVSAGNGAIRVLGTKFNVRALENTPVELYVEEGRVAFSAQTQVYDAKIFTRGQAGYIDAAAEVVRSAPPGPNVSSWISGKLVFDHAALDQVVRDLSRHYLVQMTLADSALSGCELKADFERESFADVLKTLEFSLNVQIDSTQGNYLISGEPCNPNASEE